MNKFIFTKKAEKLFFKLPLPVQEQIKAKLLNLKTYPEILSILKNLTDLEPATHRLRVGSYRVLMCLKNTDSKDKEFMVLKVGHRSTIYR